MSNEIILEKKNGWSDKEYYCGITRLLDSCSGFKKYPKKVIFLRNKQRII